MFTLLSGEAVHLSDNLRDHLEATTNTRPRSLSTAAPWVPSRVVGVVDRALELDKELRWSDARAMQSALRFAYRAMTHGLDEESVTRMRGSAPVSSGDAPPTGDEATLIASLSPSARGENTLPRFPDPETLARSVPSERVPSTAPLAPRLRRKASDPPTLDTVPGNGARPWMAPAEANAHSPPWADGSAGAPAPPLPPLPPLPLPQAPVTPRNTAGVFRTAGGRVAFVAALLVFALLAGIATFLISSGRREVPFGPRGSGDGTRGGVRSGPSGTNAERAP